MKEYLKIPEFKLIVQATKGTEKSTPRFKWASEEIGNRNKIGGEPNFLQEKEIPICPSCTKEMTFYSQIDSLSDEIIIADCGIIYTFLCFDCVEVKSIIQSN
jgi:hypothetical protein